MKSNDEEDEEDGWEADDTELTGVMATMCPTTLQQHNQSCIEKN